MVEREADRQGRNRSTTFLFHLPNIHQQQGTMGKSLLLLVAAALSAPALVAGSDVTAFVLKGTSCQKGNADIDISLTCEENGGTCRLGDKAQVSGTVTFNAAPPSDVHVDSKACLFYFGGVKLGCYNVASLDESLCSYLKGYVMPCSKLLLRL
jgi:hypothetical protein